MGKMQQTKANKKIDSFCNELESLSSKIKININTCLCP